jgi:hypothetical protein
MHGSTGGLATGPRLAETAPIPTRRDRDLVACWSRGGGPSAGLWLRDLGPVDDPQPGAIGLAAQDLHADAGVVGRAG